MSYCNWDSTSALNQKYHDKEWGVPLFSDRKQFEFLMMEAMQCGLSWDLMINRRSVFRKCFDNFDFSKIAKYTGADIERIMNFEGMIKARRKIEAIINNARRFVEIRREFGTFCNYLWAYSDFKTIIYDRHEDGYIPVSNGLSARIAADLKKRGFKFLGSITIYSHLQACGIINDHDKNCPRHKFIVENFPTIRKRRDHEAGVVYFGD